MGIGRAVILVAALLFVAGCVQNRTQAVDNTYTARLNARLAQYTAETEEKEKLAETIGAAMTKAGQATVTNASAAPVPTSYTVDDFARAAFSAAVAYGHSKTLSA